MELGPALLILVVFVSVHGLRDKSLSKNVSSTLDTLLASNRYDKRIRPGFGGPPVRITVNFFIKSMGPVSDNDQSFGLDVYFRQHWYDLRLKYDKLPGLDEIPLSWLFLDKVWKPDTYFVNGKKSHLHRITAPNKFLRLRHDGFLTYSMRLTISASCPMYLRKFPLDAQRCPLILGSYGYTSKDVIYAWASENPVNLEKGMELAQFDLVNVTTGDEVLHHRGGQIYSTLQTNYWLKRHTGYFMLQVYVPCGLIVVCSWVSFWIDPDAVPARVQLGAYLTSCLYFQVYVPCSLIVLSSWVSFWIDPNDVTARVALGVTTVLSLTTMGFGGRAQLPKVSYWTALDWFVIICFTSVFSVMIEYACVNFIDKVTKDLMKVIEQKKKQQSENQEKMFKENLRVHPQPAYYLTLCQEELEATKLAEPTIRQRSVSLSTTLVATEEPCRRVSVAESTSPASLFVQTRKASILDLKLPDIRHFPRRLSTTVKKWTDIPSFQTKLSRSTQNLSRLERGYRDADMAVPKVIVSDEVDSAGIAVNVDDDCVWTDEEEEKPLPQPPKTRTLLQIWLQWKILPQEVDVIHLMSSPEPPDKFSKIDIESRRSFPIAFFFSLTVYLIAFAYYLNDDFPERDIDLVLYKQ